MDNFLNRLMSVIIAIFLITSFISCQTSEIFPSESEITSSKTVETRYPVDVNCGFIEINQSGFMTYYYYDSQQYTQKTMLSKLDLMDIDPLTRMKLEEFKRKNGLALTGGVMAGLGLGFSLSGTMVNATVVSKSLESGNSQEPPISQGLLIGTGIVGLTGLIMMLANTPDFDAVIYQFNANIYNKTNK